MSIDRSGIGRACSTVRRHFGRRLLAAVATCVLLGCGRESIAPPTGAFPLRAVQVDGLVTVDVPASVATYADDTVRYVSGSFELGPGHQWRERWERVLVSGGVEGAPRVFESSGVYQITEASHGTLVLDLYPGQITRQNIMPTALLSGDTLSHGPFIFVR